MVHGKVDFDNSKLFCIFEHSFLLRVLTDQYVSIEMGSWLCMTTTHFLFYFFNNVHTILV